MWCATLLSARRPASHASCSVRSSHSLRNAWSPREMNCIWLHLFPYGASSFGSASLAWPISSVNTWASDSHLQFLNWTIDNNGAYDYAANTRGYTDGAILEYD